MGGGRHLKWSIGGETVKFTLHSVMFSNPVLDSRDVQRALGVSRLTYDFTNYVSMSASVTWR